MAGIDGGLAGAQKLYKDASDGVFKMDESTARHFADAMDVIIDGMKSQMDVSHALAQVDGFGSFPTGVELTAGYRAKGEQYPIVLGQFREAAYIRKAAYLRAGGLVQEADAANAAAIQVSGDQNGKGA